MSDHIAELVTIHTCVEIGWAVPYTWSPPYPATFEGPAGGGVELDGDPWPCEVVFRPRHAEPYYVTHIEAGSIRALRLIDQYGLPTLRACLLAADAAEEDKTQATND